VIFGGRRAQEEVIPLIFTNALTIAGLGSPAQSDRLAAQVADVNLSNVMPLD